jgi:DNA polymerase III sliding clamp (beta) subunit (PCNA family)
MSKEKARYYLCGVYFDEGKLVATDGHRLSIIKPLYFDGEIKSFILPDKTVKKIIATKPEYRGIPIHVSFDDNKNTATVFHKKDEDEIEVISIFPYVPIDGTFPDYKRVIPDLGAAKELSACNGVAVNPKYIASFKTLGESLTIYAGEKSYDPVVITGGFISEFKALGVLMPLRSENSEHVDFWIKEFS